MRESIYTFLGASLCAIMLSGCLIHSTHRDDGSRVEHYFGYTQVTYPKVASSGSQVAVKETENFGVGFAEGFLVGYTARKEVILPPGNGLYLDGLSPDQFQAFFNLLNELKLKETSWLLEQTNDTSP